MNFIANTLNHNGGTTFLIRISKVLSQLGLQVKVLVLYDIVNQEHLQELTQYAQVVFIKDLLPPAFKSLSSSKLNIFPPFLNMKRIESLFGSSGSVHVMGVFGLIFARRLQYHFPEMNVSIGVYHQNEFMYRSVDVYMNRWVSKQLKELDKNAIIFFNDYCKRSYAACFNKHFLDAAVLPIGIPLKQVARANTTYQKGLIVSVGNLVDFKTYNKHIVRTIYSIRETFPYVRYDIYGLGPEQESLQQLVAELELDAVVSFKGLLDYSEFEKVVAGAHVFIGNGTAVLEAANLGVPSITGIESCHDPVSYGFVSQIEGYDYNEQDDTKVASSYESLLRELFAGGELYKEQIGAACREAVKRFDIQVTAQGFISTSNIRYTNRSSALALFSLFRLFASLLVIMILDVLRLDTRFRNRRNQGNIICQ